MFMPVKVFFVYKHFHSQISLGIIEMYIYFGHYPIISISEVFSDQSYLSEKLTQSKYGPNFNLYYNK